MSLQIVSGKPGSGKSYHTVTMLLQQLEDWARFERKEERTFDCVLYTNLTLDTEKINEYLSNGIGHDVDIAHYIRPIDENVRCLFAESGGKFPLALLPQNAMIVIDEVQRMFGSEMDNDKKMKAFETEFRNYISQHRHYGHDLIFITQDTVNISKHILAMAEKLYQVENAKHHGLPFPFNVPFADLDIVKEAFGFKNQFYRVSVGKYHGRRAKFDKEVTSHIMRQDVFACYNSHTLSDVTSDRPSLNLSKVGALMWLVKKHGWHLILKLIIAVFVVVWGLKLLQQMPSVLSNALGNSLQMTIPDSKPIQGSGVREQGPGGDMSNVTVPQASLTPDPSLFTEIIAICYLRIYVHTIRISCVSYENRQWCVWSKRA